MRNRLITATGSKPDTAREFQQLISVNLFWTPSSFNRVIDSLHFNAAFVKKYTRFWAQKYTSFKKASKSPELNTSLVLNSPSPPLLHPYSMVSMRLHSPVSRLTIHHTRPLDLAWTVTRPSKPLQTVRPSTGRPTKALFQTVLLNQRVPLPLGCRATHPAPRTTDERGERER